MANLYDTGATSALNEDDYINELYDSTRDSHKKALEQAYTQSSEQLTAGQESTRQQTQDYQQRSEVETARAGSNAPVSSKAMQTQAALTLGNRRQANATTLQNQQTAVDQEYERRRKLLADQYSAQIRQAQADNDMARAQALYEAAKAEEEQLRSFRQEAGELMYKRGDRSILDQIAAGTPVSRDTESETWDTVRQNEDAIHKMYDAQLESQRAATEQEYAEAASELEARKAAQTRETDAQLNEAYIDALRRGQYSQEVQNASGLSSGAAMQSRLSREAELAKQLTDLRALQLGRDAAAEQERADLTHQLGTAYVQGQQKVDAGRNQALYQAAENEEQRLISDQEMIGKLLAQRGDYSVLGKLYGLTDEQIRSTQRRASGGKPSGGSVVIPAQKTRTELEEIYHQNMADARESYENGSITREEFMQAQQDFRNRKNYGQ